MTEAAEKLGIYASQIYSWRTALGNKRTLSERESQQAAEIARLKRQLAEQTEEPEILKKAARQFKVTTDSNHAQPVAPNLLARNFNASEPNKKWVSDITYIQTRVEHPNNWIAIARMLVAWLLLNCDHRKTLTLHESDSLLRHFF